MTQLYRGTLASSDLPRVLVVDDHPEARESLARYLRIKGFRVSEATDGRSALEAVRTEPSFSVVLVDLSLPDVDGREVGREVRRLSPDTRCMLVTGWSLEPEEYESWGIDRLFTKPVDLAELCRVLAEATPNRSGDDSVPASPSNVIRS